MTPSPLTLPTLGRVVHYRLPERYHGDVQWRPAFVVNPHGQLANLTVFLDGCNDLHGDMLKALMNTPGHLVGAVFCVGSASEGTNPGQWRWPARV